MVLAHLQLRKKHDDECVQVWICHEAEARKKLEPSQLIHFNMWPSIFFNHSLRADEADEKRTLPKSRLLNGFMTCSDEEATYLGRGCSIFANNDHCVY